MLSELVKKLKIADVAGAAGGVVSTKVLFLKSKGGDRKTVAFLTLKESKCDLKRLARQAGVKELRVTPAEGHVSAFQLPDGTALVVDQAVMSAKALELFPFNFEEKVYVAPSDLLVYLQSKGTSFDTIEYVAV